MHMTFNFVLFSLWQPGDMQNSRCASASVVL